MMLFFLTLSSVILYNCTNASDSKEENTTKKQYRTEKNEVYIQILEKSIFKNELLSNGKLVATQKNVLKFDVSENLQKLMVQNGDIVKKNQVLAILRPFKYNQKMIKANIDLKKTNLELQDMLVGRGYDIENKDSIPNKVYEMVAIRSGYKEALNQIKNAQFELNATKLIAPFKGKIANIQNKQYEHINAGENFMTIINDAFFEVEFYLIESEIKDVDVNDKVRILPFSLNSSYNGHIVNINPLVEKDGTILIKAIVKNDGKLLEGMNVNVLIQKPIKNQFVIPKSAVILRQNQEVLFKVKLGKAFWTYVQIIYENSDSYAVIPHPNKNSAVLDVGDSIIISGNLNLAHDSNVEVNDKSIK